MAHMNHSIELPPVVETTLRRVRGRLLAAAAVEAVLLALVVLLGTMMIAMLVDELTTPIETGWRVALTAASFAVAGGTFLWCILRQFTGLPWSRGLRRLSGIALEVEKERPDLQERWSTLSELAESHDPPHVRGSEAFIRQLAVETVASSYFVDPKDFPLRTRLPRLGIVLGVLMAVLLAAYLVWPETTSILLGRFWAPTGNTSQTRIRVAGGDRVVAVGENVLLVAAIEGRHRTNAKLILRSAGGGQDTVRIAAEEPHEGLPARLAHSLRAVREPLSYRWECGDARSAWFSILAVERPAIERLRLRVTPPAYSGLPVQEAVFPPYQLRALEGSLLEAEFVASKPLARMELTWGDGRREMLMPRRSYQLSAFSDQPSELAEEADVSGHGGQVVGYRYEMTLERSASFSTRLVDLHGLENLSSPSCRVIVYPDQPPAVEIVAPAPELTVKPDDTVSIEFRARDDFGIEEAELVVTREMWRAAGDADGMPAAEQRVTRDEVYPIPLGDKKGAREISDTVELVLGAMGLKSGEELSYAIHVRDARGAAHAAHSWLEHRRDAGATPADATPADATPAGEASAECARPGGTCPPGAGCERCAPGEAAADGDQAMKPDERDRGEASERPGDHMARRALDVGGEGSASSNAQRILVDEWAGSFEGHARRKLQISIDMYLQRIRASLRAAGEPVDQMIAAVRDGDRVEGQGLAPAGEHLRSASDTIAELVELSSGTPYAFIGLQLSDIGLNHINPARRAVNAAAALDDRPAEQLQSLELSAHHIGRGLELLEALTQRFEAAKQQEALEENIQRLAKMHQIFVEDVHALLEACEPLLNPREGAWRIIPDELAEEILKLVMERTERRKQLMAALAEALAEDPDLLRRYMAMTRKSSMTVRDQLTVLARRQIALRDDLLGWADRSGRNTLLSEYVQGLITESIESVRAASQLHEDLVTWRPRDVDVDAGPLAEVIEQAAILAAAMRSLPASMASDPRKADADRGKGTELLVADLLGQLLAMRQALGEIDPDGRAEPQVNAYLARRLTEIQLLETRLADWLERFVAVQGGGYLRAAAIDQQRLEADTAAFGMKMEDLANQIGSTVPATAGRMTELAAIVTEELPPPQMAAAAALLGDDHEAAGQEAEEAVATFERAEKLFDEVLTLVEDHFANLPVRLPADPAAGPSIEEELARLLEALEEEREACEGLGAVVRSNLMIQTDWAGRGEGAGGGTGGEAQGRPEQPPQEQEAPRQGPPSDAELQAAIRQALASSAAAEEMLRQMQGRVEGPDDEAVQTETAAAAGGIAGQRAAVEREEEGEDWNIFVSQLEDQLRQVRGHTPPEEYREAIDEYFRRLAEAQAEEAARRPR